jgi:carbamate kinase
MSGKKLAVVALGGNSLIHDMEKGTIDDQERNMYETCLNLVQLIERDYHIVLTHGNGPQVGNIMLSNLAGFKLFGLPDMPLDVDVAYSQGFVGYVIEQQLRNVLEEKKIERDILTIITEVLVDKNDPAFKNPTKPIGPFYTQEEAERITRDTGAAFAKDPRGRGWRRVVASPTPLRINNVHSIERLAREGEIIIAVGGGGIPVFYVKENKLQGIDAVIDKDLASSLLATQIRADEFFILTDVPKVFLDFNTPRQRPIDRLTVGEARQYLEQGQFADGSMAPKILAAIQFVENGGQETIITQAAQLSNRAGGTRIVPSR